MRERLASLSSSLAGCATEPTWTLPDQELVACFDAAQALTAMADGLWLRLLGELDARGVALEQGASSTAVWLREHTRTEARQAARLVKLARVLRERPALQAALSDGVVSADQAQAIATCLAGLPPELADRSIGPASAGAVPSGAAVPSAAGDAAVGDLVVCDSPVCDSAVGDAVARDAVAREAVARDAVAEAEAVLIHRAAQFDPAGLRTLGSRILFHVAPEIAERAEAEALRCQEERAYRGRGLTLSPSCDGRVRLSGWLDPEGAAVLNAAIDPLCDPGRRQPSPDVAAPTDGSASVTGKPAFDNAGGAVFGGAVSGGAVSGGAVSGGAVSGSAADEGAAESRSPAQRRLDALVEICRLAMSTGDLPTNGGDRPQVVVTMPYDGLIRGVKTATLDTGERISPTTARRLACDAHLIPAVLGSAGQVLDLGRSRRLIGGSLRRALVLRDRGCAFPSCDRPSRWCDGHHLVSWIDGGLTELDNSVLLCGYHHRLMHHSEWAVRLGRDRLPEFIPPAWIDPEQRPRRNHLHLRL